jgi:hypothetical protein
MDALAMAIGLASLIALGFALQHMPAAERGAQRDRPVDDEGWEWRYLGEWLVAGGLTVLGWHVVWLVTNRP